MSLEEDSGLAVGDAVRSEDCVRRDAYRRVRVTVTIVNRNLSSTLLQAAIRLSQCAAITNGGRWQALQAGHDAGQGREESERTVECPACGTVSSEQTVSSCIPTPHRHGYAG